MTLFLRAGHAVAVVSLVGTGGCECRLWWWSVFAPTTGHCIRKDVNIGYRRLDLKDSSEWGGCYVRFGRPC